MESRSSILFLPSPVFHAPRATTKENERRHASRKKSLENLSSRLNDNFLPYFLVEHHLPRKVYNMTLLLFHLFAELYGHSSSQSPPFVCGLSRAPLHSRPYLRPRLSPRRHLSRRARADFRSVSVTVAAAHLFRQQWMDLRMSGMSGWRPEEEEELTCAAAAPISPTFPSPNFPHLKARGRTHF